MEDSGAFAAACREADSFHILSATTAVAECTETGIRRAPRPQVRGAVCSDKLAQLKHFFSAILRKLYPCGVHHSVCSGEEHFARTGPLRQCIDMCSDYRQSKAAPRVGDSHILYPAVTADGADVI